ncbi:terminase large subunit domain-containing protein [Psychromicrobium lacuslunae]|uniref:terminase large subunit domain-containing protein n=1 Tax=Psychromicrobium lacuslunae TaxID=1618207 RepID=UPI002277398B|nr:terminase large subunit [Psychromicrobium lacuslunae]
MRFKTVLLLVARQNGKSFIMSTRLLWRMLMWDGPEVEPPLILGAAHKLNAAEEILDLTTKALQRSRVRGYVAHKSAVNGNKYLELTNGSRYKCEAASDDGGRGLSTTDLAFDELRQQRDWESWSALTNTTNARFSSQTIAVSNAGTGKSAVLRGLRKQALDRLDEWDRYVTAGLMDAEQFANGHDTTIGIFEWSAPEGCDIWDREGWAQANPSMGHEDEHGIAYVTEDMLASKAALVGAQGEDGVPEHVFRTENLCQWVTAAVESVFGQGVWEGGSQPDSSIAEDSKIFLSVDVSHNREMGYISAAGLRPDNNRHVEVISQRAGTEWIVPFLSENFAATGAEAVVIQGRGAPASSLIEHLEAAGVPVIRCEGSNLGAAHGRFFDAVKARTVFHVPQPVLDAAAADGVMRPLGDVSVWDRKNSPVDVPPLIACAQAMWALDMASVREADQPVSSYNSRGLVVV